MKRASFMLMTALALVAGAAVAAPDGAVAGQQVYQNNCMMCHGEQAQGTAGLAPPLKGSYWGGVAKARVYLPGVLLAGMNGPLSTDEGKFVGVMPPQNRLSDAEIAAVASYLVREVNGHASAEPLAVSEVAALRVKTPAVAELRALRKQALAQ